MSKLAVLFSGQGAQHAGMGIRLRDYPAGRDTFQKANDVLQMDIESICYNATDKELANTEITQPAIVTCSVAAFRILKIERSKDYNIDLPILESSNLSATAGLSVGEYSALVASESLSFSDALKLVKERGRLMAESADASPGTMVAVLGLDADAVTSICVEASSFGIVQPANYNCPGQIVISGEKEAVKVAVELAQKAGARKCVPLGVSGAFHSPLMQSAESGLRKVLDSISLLKPKIPFIANVTGNYIEDPKIIRETLARQLSSPIQWETSIRRMIDDGITDFMEVGPGKVLAGLVRKIYREAKVLSSEDII